MEKYSIEIKTSAGWVKYHDIMRSGMDRAQKILAELQKTFPNSKFRIVKWIGEELSL